MDKKDIYEHLAEIYLDASSKRKKEARPYSPLYKNLFFISVAVFLAVIIFVILPMTNWPPVTSRNQNKLIKYELALVLQSDIVKMNFNFDSIKEEVYSINLDKLNLARYKTLAFSVRKAHYENNVALRLEFSNAVNERAETYVSYIPSYKWQDYRINLAEFKNISDWSEVLNLSFVVGEKDTDKKSGIVYIDNVRLLR